MKQKLDRQLSATPTREQEFQLLVAAKYLVENQGKLNSHHAQVKTYKSSDGTEIKRDKDSLAITHQGKELVFGKDNATVRNTFSPNELKQQLVARNNEIQHLKLTRIQSHSLTIGR